MNRNVAFDSSSDSRHWFSKSLQTTLAYSEQPLNILKAAWLDTPLGTMVAIADENALYLLEFIDGRGIELEVERLKLRTKSCLVLGTSAPIATIERELNAYFAGNLQTFTTPIVLLGSPFQKQVWHALLGVPYGETRSYKTQAQTIESPSAFRAVANANGANQLAIIVPCHRIITSGGDLGGYGGGVHRKKWLLDHEARFRG